jgi:hypothetical protein
MILKNLVALTRQEMANEAIPARTIEEWARDTLEPFAEAIAQSKHASDLQRTDSVALDGSGIASVPSDMLPGYIISVTHADVAEELIKLDDPAEFKYQFNNQFGYWALRSGKIHTKAPASVEAGVLPTPISVTGIFIPTLATIPAKHDALFVQMIVAQHRPAPKRQQAPAAAVAQ